MKWLGSDAISALAINGKDGKAEMLERVARWVAAAARYLHPISLTHHPIELTFGYSDDRVL